MHVLRKHWYDFGAVIAVLTILFIYTNLKSLTDYQLLLWLSFVSLLFHQLEEYRIVGSFPGMVNRVMYNSDLPDRFPLNTNTAFYVNVVLGWTTYLLAAILAEKAVWLGMATMIVSAGNIMAHTLLFNIKGKTWYNAGMASSWLFFVPCVYCFFSLIHDQDLVSKADYLIGVPLGILLNLVGVIKLIDWCADKNTSFIFEQRNLLPADRNK
jgi:hypothetical protein